MQHVSQEAYEMRLNKLKAIKAKRETRKQKFQIADAVEMIVYVAVFGWFLVSLSYWWITGKPFLFYIFGGM